MVPPDAERIIRDAATATRAYHELIRAAAENPRYRLALIDCRVMVDQELRGEPRVAPASPDMMEPIAVSVERELEEMRPAVEIRVAQWRAIRRLSGCGYVQLALSRTAQVKRRLRKLIKDSGLSIREFALTIGITESAMHDHLVGKIPRSRLNFYRDIESVTVRRGTITIVKRRGSPTEPRRPKRRD